LGWNFKAASRNTSPSESASKSFAVETHFTVEKPKPNAATSHRRVGDGAPPRRLLPARVKGSTVTVTVTVNAIQANGTSLAAMVTIQRDGIEAPPGRLRSGRARACRKIRHDVLDSRIY